MPKGKQTYHIEEHGRGVEVGVLFGILDLDSGEDDTSTLDLNARRVNSSQLELLHVPHSPRKYLGGVVREVSEGDVVRGSYIVTCYYAVVRKM